LTAAAFLVRTTAIAVLRRRHADAADAVDRWWVWTPLVVVLMLLVVLLAVVTWNVPPLGISLTVAFCFVIYRGLFSASSIGSPFRPRR
jgi:predicted lysophospholipase L1 biosynthesis ABC-type transport system permease subunit